MFNSDWYIRILVLLGLLFFCLLFFLTGMSDLSVADILRKVSSSTMLVLLFHYCFENYLWRCKWLRPLIVKVPNLHGTWKGNLQSSWIDPETGNALAPIDITVYIKQSFSSISVEIHTDKMISTSYIAGFRTDSETGLQELCYTYSSKAHLATRENNPWHDGTTKLTIYEGQSICLTGEYWTARKTIGTLSMNRISTSIERNVAAATANQLNRTAN